MSPTVPTAPTTGDAAPRGIGVTKVAAAVVAVVAPALVLVSEDFEVTGLQQGGPPAGATGAPPSSQSAPSAPSTSDDASTQSS